MAKSAELKACLRSLLEHPEQYSTDDECRTEILELVHKVSVQLETPFETFQCVCLSVRGLSAKKPMRTNILPYSVISVKLQPSLTPPPFNLSALSPPTLPSNTAPFKPSRTLMGSPYPHHYLSNEHIAKSTTSKAFCATFTRSTSRNLQGPMLIPERHKQPDTSHAVRGRLSTHHDAIYPAFSGIAGFLNPPFKTAWNIGHATPLSVFECALNSTDNSILFVDVGGSLSHQCAALRAAHPTILGRIVMQDRPEVVAQALPDVEKMEYDYRTAQSLKWADAYYFRQILHDNKDEVCIDILRNQLPAMGPSFVNIDEKILPDTQPSEYLAGLSRAMRACYDAKERSERQWKDMLDRAVFAVKEIGSFTRYGDAVIIAVPKDALNARGAVK